MIATGPMEVLASIASSKPRAWLAVRIAWRVGCGCFLKSPVRENRLPGSVRGRFVRWPFYRDGPGVKSGVLGDGMEEMEDRDRDRIEMRPIGFVRRTSPNENERDRSLVAKVVFDEDLAPALDGIEEWSHIYVIFWLDRVVCAAEPELHHQGSGVGILAARSPIHPNPLGLTLVELVKRERNVLFVRGLDAYDGTPVVDVKPYPDWEQGHFIVVTDFRVPGWLTEVMERQESVDEAGA